MAFGDRKKGERSARGAHFATGKKQESQGGAGTPLAREGSGDLRPPVGPDPLESETPRPIGDDAMATGSFEKLDAGQGAVVTTRDNAGDAAEAARNHLSGTTGMMRLDVSDLPEVESHASQTHANKRAVVLLVVLTAAVILGGVYLFSRLTASSGPQPQEQQEEQLQTSTADSIEYRGTTYRLEQGDGRTWHLMRQSEDEGAEEQSLGDLPGTPVTLVLYNGEIVIPENKADGTWDVMAYVLGSGWSQVLDDGGNAYSGQGSVSGATLDGSQLSLTTDSGTQTVPLNW